MVAQAAHSERPHIPHAVTTPNLHDYPDSLVSDHAPRFIDSGAPLHPPTPISLSDDNAYSDHEAEAGPSYSHSPSQSAALPIPPPPPRRHRSGVLMSRVRAHSSGTNFKAGGSMPGSKSWGDISAGLAMSSADPEREEGVGRQREGSRDEKRMFSEGHRRGSKDEEGLWDNSARYYHHLHSRPPSRSASRSVSPNLSPTSPSRSPSTSTSTSTSPIHVRRSLTLPQHAALPLPGAGVGVGSLNTSLSPNHQFLQTHLPLTFPESPEQSLAGSHHTSSRVILTPTTQEWRELQELRRLEGDEAETPDGSSTGSDESRRSSLVETDHGSLLVTGSMLLRPDSASTPPKKPSLRSAMSADYLSRETMHTPDPGSPVLIPPDGPSPDRPVFNPVIIAPSPIMPENAKVPIAPGTPSRDGGALGVEGLDEAILDSPPESAVDLDQPLVIRDETDVPMRFSSIGRRESLQPARGPNSRPGVPRLKTKRELERERLFKDLDEELEADRGESGLEDQKWNAGVQEIGKGGGLGSAPNSADGALFEPQHDIFDKQFSSVENPVTLDNSPILAPKPMLAQVSPKHQMKPSPLHASPLNAASGLPTPDDTPLGEPPMIELPSPQGSPQPIAANLDTIRDYARSLVSPHPGPAHIRQKTKSRPTTPKASPPSSPRSVRPRRRDTTRVSLVAGRVVQPFAIPSSTSLPPPDSKSSLQATPSLQSFSPFRSPSLSATKPSGYVPPIYHRFDSTISLAPSTGAPSECGTPTSETAGGIGGRGIDDYVILKEAGKGAYGLVMRAKVKGPKGEPVGEEVIIKYIIKARILADCWKKHKQLGPIPVEIHVMDQLRHLLYNPPLRPHPWDPTRARSTVEKKDSLDESAPGSPGSLRSDSSGSFNGMFSPTQKYIASEIKHSPERGHPNICKLLDFFEDREFYYLVMPRYGTGVDLFDRVESQPDGLDPFEVRSLVGQLADAVRFLHSNGIVHRDIKDENVILDGTGRCQLIDFGSAAQWRPGKRWDTFSGTLHYASPEILRGEMYGGKEQDVWALGVVAYVLLVGETPFSELPDEVLIGLTSDSGAELALEERCGGLHVSDGLENDGGGRLEDAMDLVRRCLERETSDRPTAEMICQHRYLRGEGGWTGRKGWIGKGWR